MRKPLAGKRAFEAMGRSASSRGQPFTPAVKEKWPAWAQIAWRRGWALQPPIKQK